MDAQAEAPAPHTHVLSLPEDHREYQVSAQSLLLIFCVSGEASPATSYADLSPRGMRWKSSPRTSNICCSSIHHSGRGRTSNSQVAILSQYASPLNVGDNSD